MHTKFAACRFQPHANNEHCMQQVAGSVLHDLCSSNDTVSGLLLRTQVW